MFGNVWFAEQHFLRAHNLSLSSEDRIIREEVVNRDVKRMSLHAQQHHAQWPFNVQESGLKPSTKVCRSTCILADYIHIQGPFSIN